MARGQAQAAGNQLGITNAAAGQEQGRESQLYGQLRPEFTNMLNMGLDPATQAALTRQGEGAVASSFGASGEQASNRVARTRNDAGFAAQEDQQARDRGMAMGDVASKNVMANQAEIDKNRAIGLGGLGNLYGTSVQSKDSLYGLGPGTLQARAAGGKGWFDSLMQAGAGAAGGLASV
jgi:hypothetical protein